MKIFLTLLVFSSLSLYVISATTCSNGALAGSTLDADKCKLKGMKYTDASNCAAADLSFCQGLGLTGDLCTPDSGSNTGTHCVPINCSEGTYTGAGSSAALCW